MRSFGRVSPRPANKGLVSPRTKPAFLGSASASIPGESASCDTYCSNVPAVVG